MFWKSYTDVTFALISGVTSAAETVLFSLDTYNKVTQENGMDYVKERWEA
jgi:hypothetical protein